MRQQLQSISHKQSSAFVAKSSQRMCVLVHDAHIHDKLRLARVELSAVGDIYLCKVFSEGTPMCICPDQAHRPPQLVGLKIAPVVNRLQSTPCQARQYHIPLHST